MHGFALIMGSVFGHKVAVNVIKKCQKLVTSTKSSNKLKHWVHEEYLTLKKHSPKHKKLTWLVQAATTRFSSTYNCMLSVQQMEVAFKNVADKHQAEIIKDGTAPQKAMLEIIRDKRFWRDLESYTPLAEPFNQACLAPAPRCMAANVSCCLTMQ